MRFFFYGTLIDDDVRALVLGSSADGAAVCAATLAGWSVVRVQGKTYPVIARRRGTADGVLTGELDDSAFERLVRYEGPEYEAAALDVTVTETGEAVRAAVFVPSDQCRMSVSPWRFEDWQRRHKREFLARLRARGIA